MVAALLVDHGGAPDPNANRYSLVSAPPACGIASASAAWNTAQAELHLVGHDARGHFQPGQPLVAHQHQELDLGLVFGAGRIKAGGAVLDG